MADPLEQLGREALAAFETLSESPDARTYERMAGAVRCLVKMRNHLIDEQRRNDGAGGITGERLVRLNSILSMAVGAAYPLVGVRPERLEMTRDALRDLLQSES